MISFACHTVSGQNSIDLRAVFNIEKKQITISQTIQYQNTSNDVLQTIYLNDWNNSYATKKTPLANRIAEEYKYEFHLAKNEDRGYSVITSIKQNHEELFYENVKGHLDIIKVELKTPLKPKEFYNINLSYIIQIPSDKFTGYGITPTGDINLRYWYITPAVYNGSWQYFSNKDLDDLFIPEANVNLEIVCPIAYKITSELNVSSVIKDSVNQTVKLKGNNVVNNKLFLSKTPDFNTIKSDKFSLISNIKDENLAVIDKVLISEKISNFIFDNLGPYPHEKLLLTNIDYEKNPIYGLNFLPKFIHPYPENFQYELKILKIALYNYLENVLLVNPRKDQWLLDGLQIYYLMKYVEINYPNMKFLGSFANVWGIRSFHAADLNFNDKYMLAYMMMARTNRDQPLTMAKDSLLKFNKNIANKYKAGIGFKYLDDFINSDVLETTIKSFLVENSLKETSGQDFETFLKSKTNKDVEWFFSDYLKTRGKIDFKIKNVSKTEDSITLTIKNKVANNMPISLYTLNNDSVVSKTWIENITESKTITIPRNDANKLVLNYENIIPEINLRDNWKSLKGFFFNNKPLQFRVFKDIEDPNYNQVFFMPIIEFNNIYDGLTLGVKTYNKTLLRKHFNYKLEPKYSLKSKSLTGSANIYNIHDIENSNLYLINYGVRGGYESYAENLFVREITPYLSFFFRDDKDFRSNIRNALYLRYLDINRDRDIYNILNTSEPNYNILNMRYVHSNDNLVNYDSWYADFQVAKTFTKVSFNYEYRKLFENNRQLNLRAFTGAFLKNINKIDSNYFSFALDRPTDYLFDYAYLGRSESTGIFSQQYIDTEGGFKSKLENPFANQWMTTFNASTTLWRDILFYSDFGLVKNKFAPTEFVHDSGIRINLVIDYFEIYFPIYSNLGWEIGQPNYDQKIRFKFTVDPKSLFGLFRRRWY
tara:strand:- start:2571 stop:5375 length:2805 start_codon:yes stop_codon:yes gene_type:complete